jgi:hypothetical protein
MNIARILLAGAIAVAIVDASGARLGADTRENEDIKLSGCLVRGEDGGYLLINSPSEPGLQATADSTVAPSAVGTAGNFATIFYWMKDHNDLKEHVGHRVEVEGDFEGDIKEGDIKIDRKDKWTEIRVKSDGRDLRARVPHSSIVSSPSRDKREGKVLIRKVDVDHVRMLAANCQP